MLWHNLSIHAYGQRRCELALPASAIRDELEADERRFQAALRSGHVLPRRARRLGAEAIAILRVRQNQAWLSTAEQFAFKNAVQHLVDDGTYQSLARIYRDTAHRMQGLLGPVGLYRFLPWHRRYLWEFETQLQRADRLLRPTGEPIRLPYWKWPDPFPSWLDDFLPVSAAAAPARHAQEKLVATATVGSNGAHRTSRTLPPRMPSRRMLDPPLKPTHADVELLLAESGRNLPGTAVGDFVRFSYALEGWAQRPNGLPLPARNQVQDWVGGILSSISDSPADPIFWLIHAEVDRLWSLWQSECDHQGPPLLGRDRILDPWPETCDEVANTLALGYVYE